MLKAYVDRGARPDAGGVMCAVATFFIPPKYKTFCRRWNRMLGTIALPNGDRPPYFHAKDFYPGGGIFSGTERSQLDKAARVIPSIIDAGVKQVLGISFREEEYDRRVPRDLKESTANIYTAALEILFAHVGQWADSIGYNGPIAYVFEAGDEGQAFIDDMLSELTNGKRQNIARDIRYHSHMFVKKGEGRGVEASDCVAWHWNKYFAETVYVQKREMRADFEAMTSRHPEKYLMFRYMGDTLGEFLDSRKRLDEA
jgi:hypothetical protein